MEIEVGQRVFRQLSLVVIRHRVFEWSGDSQLTPYLLFGISPKFLDLDYGARQREHHPINHVPDLRWEIQEEKNFLPLRLKEMAQIDPSCPGRHHNVHLILAILFSAYEFLAVHIHERDIPEIEGALEPIDHLVQPRRIVVAVHGDLPKDILVDRLATVVWDRFKQAR